MFKQQVNQYICTNNINNLFGYKLKKSFSLSESQLKAIIASYFIVNAGDKIKKYLLLPPKFTLTFYWELAFQAYF